MDLDQRNVAVARRRHQSSNMAAMEATMKSVSIDFGRNAYECDFFFTLGCSLPESTAAIFDFVSADFAEMVVGVELIR